MLQTAVVSLCLSTAPALNHVISYGSWWSWVSSRMQMLTRLRWWPSCMLRVDVMFGCSGGVLPSVLWCCWLGGRKGIWPVKTEWWGAGVVVCLEWGADLHMAHLMPLPLTVSCFSKTPIGFTFLVPAYPGSPGKRAVKRVCVCVCVAVVVYVDICVCGWRLPLGGQSNHELPRALPPEWTGPADATRRRVDVHDQHRTERTGRRLRGRRDSVHPLQLYGDTQPTRLDANASRSTHAPPRGPCSHQRNSLHHGGFRRPVDKPVAARYGTPIYTISYDLSSDRHGSPIY